MTTQPSRASLAIAMIAIGLASLVYGNDSFLWYTIPDMPGSALLVYLCGLVALASGIGLFLPSYLLRACRTLVVYLGLWLVVLKLTTLLASPGEMTRWESCGETMAMLAGALCLLAMHAGEWEKRRVPFLVGERGIRIARYLLIAALVTFGLVHFAYADRTASLVPRWLPFPLFWVYLTGIANIAAAAGMLLGFYPRLAATLAAAMLWAFTLLVWIPRVTSAPSDQGNWTEWILSAAIAAGAWLVAETWRGEPWKVRRSLGLMKHFSSLRPMVLWLSLFPMASIAAESPPNPGTAFITGSDRGIGFALVQEFESRGWQVIATARDPAKATDLNAFAKTHPRVTVEKLDVTDTAGIDALALKLKGRPIDALVNNAGIAGTFEGQQTATLDQDEFVRVLRVNSYAPLRVSAAFLDHVAASRQRKIIGVSSGYGSLASVESIASAGYPNSYFYAMSKAALNMGLREFALDPGAKRGVTTVLLSPGAVDTDMQRAIRADVAQAGRPITLPTRTPAEVAHAMVLAIEQLTPEQNGRFYSLAGKEVPW